MVMLTLKFAFVDVLNRVLPDKNFGGHLQTDHTRCGHEKQHDKLLTHHPQGLVFAAVD